MASLEYKFVLKIIIVGDSAVGKSCILNQFVQNYFNPHHDFTVGVEFGARILTMQNGDKIKLQIWDTAGQEVYLSIIKSYFKGANGAILCYDITRYDTFNHIIHWLDQVKQEAKQDCKLILIGTKCDLEHKREVSVKDGQELAAKYNMEFFETSSKTKVNIEECFTKLTTICYDTLCDKQELNSLIPPNTLILKEKKRTCCIIS
jgi:Ras-related protein Rab-2A